MKAKTVWLSIAFVLNGLALPFVIIGSDLTSLALMAYRKAQ